MIVITTASPLPLIVPTTTTTTTMFVIEVGHAFRGISPDTQSTFQPSRQRQSGTPAAGAATAATAAALGGRRHGDVFVHGEAQWYNGGRKRWSAQWSQQWHLRGTGRRRARYFISVQKQAVHVCAFSPVCLCDLQRYERVDTYCQWGAREEMRPAHLRPIECIPKTETNPVTAHMQGNSLRIGGVGVPAMPSDRFDH
jgi:hypothetical protein